jgi:adenosylmethionine-8-amino-7-oxononanoate aminotransferase
MDAIHRGVTRGNTQDAYFPRSAAAAMPTIVGGHGVYLTDDAGRELIDVCSGPFLACLGQGNERVIEAMAAQARQLTYTYSRSTRHPANAEYSARLTSLAGPGFERAHLTSGGSEANEMAVKMLRAWAVASGEPQRTRVISLMPGYHGATVQTLAMNGDLGVGPLWEPLTVAAERIPAPLTYRAASAEVAAADSLAALEAAIARLGPEHVLAVIMEPMGGQASGVNVPHRSFAQGVRKACTDNGIAVVYDEIVTGLRTGALLAAHHQPEVQPDIVTMAKGLGAGYAPLGAVLTSAEFADDLADSTGFVVSHSYDANPIACAAGSAVLDEVVDRNLIEHAATLGERIRTGIDDIARDSRVIGDVRGRGLLLGIELVTDRATQGRFDENSDPGSVLIRRGLDRGLLLYSRRQNRGRFGDWILVAPPLVMDDATADSVIDRLGDVLAVSPEQLAHQ